MGYDLIAQVIKSNYGIEVRDITELKGGWSAQAYKLCGTDGRSYFLKLYDLQRSLTQSLIGSMETCMAAAAWLGAVPRLAGRINAPRLLPDGRAKCEESGRVFMLFDYIDGVTLDDAPLTGGQKRELAETVALLHCHGEEAPFDFSHMREDFAVPCADIKRALDTGREGDMLYEFRDMLTHAVNLAQRLAEYTRGRRLKHVICHTDIHGWNLMQADRLVLIDWDTMKLAPPEADLYNFWGAHFWESFWDDFLRIYRVYHPGYEVDERVMMFYKVRRRLEDIDAFYREITGDELTAQARLDALGLIRRECGMLENEI